MVEYITLLNQREFFVKDFHEKLRAAQEADQSVQAANTLQRAFRGSSCRGKLTKKHYAANEAQRVIRGIFGRMRAQQHAQEKENNRQLSLFNYFCILIQRCFRGYYSRKYKHDQARRKRYVAQLQETNDRVRNQIKEASIDQTLREEAEAEEKRVETFKSYARNLHHLLSTNHIAGVFRPSHEFMEAPTMNNMRVEDHIRGVVKDLLRTRGISKTGLVTTISATKKVPLKGLKNRLSIQASAPYDTVEKEKKREKHLHSIITRGKGDFLAAGKTQLINKAPAPLHATGEPFMDAWANPLLVKGVPRDQKQLLESTRTQKPLFQTHIEKPFVSKVGGNRSSTLPNDLFDVIAEAEETGGAIHRHLGKSARFGVPASADNRLDGTAPRPPIRASAKIKSLRPRVRTTTINVTLNQAPLLSSSTDSSLTLPQGMTGDRKGTRGKLREREAREEREGEGDDPSEMSHSQHSGAADSSSDED